MGNIDKYQLLVNFIIASTGTLGILLLLLYILGKEKVKETLANTGKISREFTQSVVDFLNDLSLIITPKKGKIRDYYEKLLLYSNLTVEKFFKIKNVLLVVVLAFMLTVSYTDMTVSISKLYNDEEYGVSAIVSTTKYTEEEKARIQEEKNRLFDELKDRTDIKDILAYDQVSAEYVISGIIQNMNQATGIDSNVLAIELYTKLMTYQASKHIDLENPFLITLVFYFLPEVIMYILQFLNKSNEKAEKRFLKRLIIMNGSIKPTDFMMVLSELIDKSKYFKKILLEIEDSNKKNYEENTKIYQKYIQSSADLETKLFFEKLDEANNYDFDQAIINIKNEFNLDKRMQTRKCKKMVENIHVWGLVGFMMLIVMIIFYLLMPWMSAYDIGALM